MHGATMKTDINVDVTDGVYFLLPVHTSQWGVIRKVVDY